MVISAGVDATTAGSDDASGTLRVHKDDFKMYNVNVKNTFGKGVQAIALSQYGSRVGLYGCGFYGYQDTLYANQGTQVYLKGYIEVFVHCTFSPGVHFHRRRLIGSRALLTLSLDVKAWRTSGGTPSLSVGQDASLLAAGHRMILVAVRIVALWKSPLV